MKHTKPETHQQRTLLTGLLLSLCVLPLTLANNFAAHQESAHGAPQKIGVRISAARVKIQPGESIRLRVEICNEGSESVFVAATFDAPDNTLAKLKISFFHDGSRVDGSKERSAGDYGHYAPDEHTRLPLAGELSKYWVPIAPRHFYGGDFMVGPSSFPVLNTPGKYMVRGTYASAGFLGEGMNNPLAPYVEELSRLPYQPWVGEVETNPIWIEVVQPRQSKTGGKH